MLWDFNWLRQRNPDDIVLRLADHASDGDIIVIHDGHHENPSADRRYAVETLDRLIPELRARGFQFGTICPNGNPAPATWELHVDALRHPRTQRSRAHCRIAVL